MNAVREQDVVDYFVRMAGGTIICDSLRRLDDHRHERAGFEDGFARALHHAVEATVQGDHVQAVVAIGELRERFRPGDGKRGRFLNQHGQAAGQALGGDRGHFRHADEHQDRIHFHLIEQAAVIVKCFCNR